MRALVLLLCLALAAHALYGANADDRPYCTDPKTNVKIAEGEVLLPADGSCSRQLCKGGAGGPRLVTEECSKPIKIPRRVDECKVKPGVKDAPYPDCCVHIKCSAKSNSAAPNQFLQQVVEVSDQ